MRKTVKVSVLLAIIIAYGFNLNAQTKETQCEEFYKEGKKAFDKEDYEVALIFFNRCKAEDCKNAGLQTYIEVCSTKLGLNSKVVTTNTIVGKDTGVDINGVVWATCNVGDKGKFVSNPNNKGEYYTYEEAQNVCPTGWRLPTKDELETLYNSGTPVWGEMNRIKGCYFGSGKKLFLPAAGGGWDADAGCYWSKKSSSGTYYMYFRDDIFDIKQDIRISRFSVRCVKE